MSVSSTASWPTRSRAHGRPAPARAPNGEPLLRPQDAADLLSVRLSWVYEAVRDGRLPCIHVGRHIRFLRTDLEGWIDDLR